MSNNSKAQKIYDFHQKLLKEKIVNYLSTQVKSLDDAIQADEIASFIRMKFSSQFGRKPETQLKKQVQTILDQLYQEISGTNIQKTFFKKRDLVPSDQQGDSSLNITKLSINQSEEDFKEGNSFNNDHAEEKLINYTTKNLLNQMLPYGQAESQDKKLNNILGKRQSNSNLDANNEMIAPKSKRQNTNLPSSLSEFQQKQNQANQSKELAAKYLIQSQITYADLGGIGDVIKQLKQMIEWPLRYSNIFEFLGVKPPRGILISGPPGTGKTQLAMAICGENTEIPFYKLNGPEIVSGLSGQSEEKIRNIFQAVKESAPAIIFIDELDSIAGKRENAAKDLEIRIVAQLAASLDDLDSQGDEVIVIGATSRPESIDQGLRRAGRFEREISLGVPNEDARIEILQILTRGMRLRKDFNFKELVKLTPGYVGADLTTLCKEASIIAVERIIKDQETLDDENEEESDKMFENIYIELEDFQLASKRVQPSAQREGFSTVPNTTWSDVGALSSVRAELQMTIVEPILNPEKFRRIGLTAPAGVLLYGPPGCGKTLVAKAVSNESKANFISIKGPELLNKYVGESEKAVRQLFKRARASAPCIIFFDELDSLVPRRGSENNTSSERVVNQLLTEMDGLDERRDVFVIAATNRPDIIDPAMLRPGRLDKLLYVPLPTKDDRLQILKTVTRKLPISKDVNLKIVASSDQCEGYSGADLSALVREAQLNALKGSIDTQDKDGKIEQIQVTMRDFTIALTKVFPSVSKKDEMSYQSLEKSLRKSRSHINPTEKEK